MAAAVNRPDVSHETEPPSLAEVIDEYKRLQTEVRVLIGELDHEFGRRYMTFELKLQIEKVELLLRLSFD